MSTAAYLPPGTQVSGVARRLKWINSGIDRLQVEVDGPAMATRADIAGIERTIRRLESTKLSLIAKADQQRIHTRTGDASTSAFVAGATGSGGATASGQVALATSLTELPTTRAALSTGDVSTAGAAIIASALKTLPEELTDSERAKVEASLLRDARHLDPGKLRKAATLAVAAAGRSAQDVAEHEEEVLTEQERRAYAASTLTLHDHGDGTTTGRFIVPTLVAHMLKKIVDSMCAPRRDHLRSRDGAAASAADDENESTTHPSVGAALRGDEDWGQLDWAQKRGRALVAILEHLPTDSLTGKVASSVVVTMTLEQVLGATNAATLTRATGVETGNQGVGATRVDTGDLLSTGAARRLACNAGLLPAVLGSASVPVDLGRERRLFSEPQRTALATLYDECAAEGCERPYAWCELHHRDPWTPRASGSPGGRTDLDKAVPLCGWHHRHLHDPRTRHHVTQDPTGRKVVLLSLRT